MRNGLLVLPLIALVCLAAACGDDDDAGPGGSIGAPCIDDRDCGGRCVGGGDFPGGMCTYSCIDDHDCPSGTFCVDKAGGVCAVACSYTGDCYHSGFSSSYACKSTSRKGGPGDVMVCRGD